MMPTDRLAALDARITRCAWCGNHTWESNTCLHCRKHGYPAIYDSTPAAHAA